MKTALLCVLLSVFSVLHEFHITHTTIHYNSEKESLEITIKLAVEDLEKALTDQGVPELKIGTTKEHEKADQYMLDYVQQRLKIQPNSTPTEYTWIGKEVSKDLHDVYIYTEITNCNKNGELKSLEVENPIFTEIFSDQANVVLIEFQDAKHNLTFTKDQKKQSVSLLKD